MVDMDLTSVLVVAAERSPWLVLLMLVLLLAAKGIKSIMALLSDIHGRKTGTEQLRLILATDVQDKAAIVLAFASQQAVLMGQRPDEPDDGAPSGTTGLATVTSITREPAAEEKRDGSGP